MAKPNHAPTDADRENTLAAGRAGALEDILYLVEARVMGLHFIPSDCLSPHQIGYLSELHRIRTMLERRATLSRQRSRT